MKRVGFWQRILMVITGKTMQLLLRVRQNLWE
jgi:hypothetical protein